jgi:putative alpha-1,2-mannosidase
MGGIFWVKRIVLTLAVGTNIGQSTAAADTFDPLSYVDPLIGSNNGGNVFVGASLPFGMAKAVADVNGENTGGFATDGSQVTGFSSMHDSGTGGNPSLGNFPIFPQYCADNVIDNCNFLIANRAVNYVNGSVVATPGYFAVGVESGIHAEMTTTEHAALYKFTLPTGQTANNGSALKPLVLLDLTDLWQSRQNASISVDPLTGQIRANGTFLPSFGAGSYQSYVCVDFAGATVFDSGVWVNNRAGTEPKDLFVTRGFNLFYLEAGGFVRFDQPESNTLYARVGVSLVSTDKACQNAETEIPQPTSDFGRIQQAAEAAWRQQLSPVSIQPGGASEDMQKLFWTGIYHSMLSPQDYTGENPLWESSEPYYDSFYW